MKYQSPTSLRRPIAWLAACILLWTLAGPLCADSLSDRIDALLKDPSLDHGIQGVMVKSLTTGSVLYEHNADLALIPASNMKLLVSAAALDQLGPDFAYRTEVYSAKAPSSAGVLAGDLFLRGGGDPILETADLAKLAREIKGRGITKITGGIVVDDTLFDDQRLGWGWSWDDEPYYYSAQVSALNLNRNVVAVYVYPGKSAGSAARVHIDPPTGHLKVHCSAVTGAADSQKALSVDRTRGRNVITVHGSIPAGSKVTNCEELITVEEPAVYAGHIFKAEMSKQGVRVMGGVKPGRLPREAALLCAHASPPLSDILRLLNKPSDNLIAEVLLKTLGAVMKNAGTTDAGAEAELEILPHMGLDTKALKIVDGSGLSRLNYISARNLVALLTHMHSHRHGKVYIDSLPVAGVDGTLRARMKGAAAEKNVKAKSGYVSRVSSLSGYVNTASGEPLVFSIIMNNHLCANSPARAVQDRICTLLAELP